MEGNVELTCNDSIRLGLNLDNESSGALRHLNYCLGSIVVSIPASHIHLEIAGDPVSNTGLGILFAFLSFTISSFWVKNRPVFSSAVFLKYTVMLVLTESVLPLWLMGLPS